MIVSVPNTDWKQTIYKMGSYKVWGINTGVCPSLECDDITLINCLGYDSFIYGAFKF